MLICCDLLWKHLMLLSSLTLDFLAPPNVSVVCCSSPSCKRGYFKSKRVHWFSTHLWLATSTSLNQHTYHLDHFNSILKALEWFSMVFILIHIHISVAFRHYVLFFLVLRILLQTILLEWLSIPFYMYLRYLCYGFIIPHVCYFSILM